MYEQRDLKESKSMTIYSYLFWSNDTELYIPVELFILNFWISSAEKKLFFKRSSDRSFWMDSQQTKGKLQAKEKKEHLRSYRVYLYICIVIKSLGLTKQFKVIELQSSNCGNVCSCRSYIVAKTSLKPNSAVLFAPLIFSGELERYSRRAGRE